MTQMINLKILLKMSQHLTLLIRTLKLQLSLRLKSKRLMRLSKMRKKSRSLQGKSVELAGKRGEEKDVPKTKRRERTGVVP